MQEQKRHSPKPAEAHASANAVLSNNRRQRRRLVPALITVCLVVVIALVSVSYWLTGRSNPDGHTDRTPIATSDQGQTPDRDAAPTDRSRRDGRADRTQITTISQGVPSDPDAAPRKRADYFVDGLAKFDPAADGWYTEVINQLAGKQLKIIGKLLGHPDDIDRPHVSKVATPSFSCTPLRPGTFERVFQDEAFTVLRASDTEDLSDDTSAPHQGLAGLVTALKDLAAAFDGASDVRVKFKIFRVSVQGTRIETEVLYLASGRAARGTVQQNATWHCRWVRPGDDGPLLLDWIGVKKYEEVVGPKAVDTIFADCTEAVLGNNRSFHEQLVPSLNHWRANLQASLEFGQRGFQGLAVGDVNGDGLDDLFVCQTSGLPNHLFVQNMDGTATDVSTHAGVDTLDRSRGALLIDLDNDGDQDLVLVARTIVLFFSNDGSGRFSKTAAVATGTSTSLSAADYDNDGDLDIYVCGYSAPTGTKNTPIPYHDANNGFPNRLLRNDGRWRFTDVTSECGLDVNNRRFSFAAAWEDYDNDGDLDLYVANDFGRNNLYRNDGGHFVDVAAQAGVEDISAGMGVTWGDYNNDGLMDLYVSNMFSSAGGRVTYQRKFRQHDDKATRALIQRHARGNSLFENAGDGTFKDISVEAGVTMGRWAWASHFFDINNDGLEDIIVANGFLSNYDSKDL